MIGGKHGSPRTGGYSDPLKLAMLWESLEPRGFPERRQWEPLCLLSGNPCGKHKILQRQEVGGGAARSGAEIVADQCEDQVREGLVFDGRLGEGGDL